MARTARNRSRNSSPPVERRREPSPEYDSATDDDESELDDVVRYLAISLPRLAII